MSASISSLSCHCRLVVSKGSGVPAIAFTLLVRGNSYRTFLSCVKIHQLVYVAGLTPTLAQYARYS
jgi:hypothetical protein